MDEIYRWKKKPQSGRHRFIYAGRRYSVLPGMMVEVPRSALGAAIAKYECLDLIGNPIDITMLDSDNPEFIDGSLPAQKELILVPHGNSKTRYDIINPDNPGKPLNDKSLKLEDAEKILGKMLAELRAPAEPNEPKITFDFSNMDWDALAIFMEEAGLEIKDEYETEDDLRAAIIEAMK